jgi:hypothetical protein
MMLVVLASACHDARMHAEPERFLLRRTTRWCSMALATGAMPQAIAGACAQAWAELLHGMPLAWTYQASPNARIPVFKRGEIA